MIENNIFSILEIIAGTPFWAWILLGYIIFKGLTATRNHVIFLSKIFIIPAVLIGIMFLENSSIGLYLLFLTIGIAIGMLLSFKIPITILKESKAIEVPGTYSKLIILLIFFSIKS
ncbi:MAG TPA: hypothetical protein LFW21_07325 [Rickettsia endosymbiont of Pyrocoelia pectoralis]|nr:hypothetical protein [Rickettsia endosymbiont of Pyrocoelia pectoralis]